MEFILKERIEEVRRENERRTWELWLHKVWGQSYKEFCDEAVEHAENQVRAMQMDKTDIRHAADTALNTLTLLRRGGEPC